MDVKTGITEKVYTLIFEHRALARDRLIRWRRTVSGNGYALEELEPVLAIPGGDLAMGEFAGEGRRFVGLVVHVVGVRVVGDPANGSNCLNLQTS
jgi:hypothetical protein